MMQDETAGVPATCLRCGSRAATRWQVTGDAAHYSCWPCGCYLVDWFEARNLVAPFPPRLAGRFLIDVTGVRWLLAR